MKLIVLCIGKTNESYLKNGIAIYQQRLPHYSSFEYVELKDVKHPGTASRLLELEAQAFMQFLQPDDFLILLDEHGKSFSSEGLASLIGKHQNASTRRLVFAIGGAFGWGTAVRQRANLVMTMSEMTFSHQMIRLFLVEQLYRAFTIIKGEKYHNP